MSYFKAFTIINETVTKKGLCYEDMDPNAVAEEYQKQLRYEKLDLSKADIKLKEKFKNYPPQPLITYNGEKGYRLRAEIIVLDNKNNVLVDLTSKRGFNYEFPGGGIDAKEKIEHAAKRECEEEALIIPKNVKFVNVAYSSKYYPKVINTGVVSLVCVGRYDKPYKGYVKVIDRDEFVDRAVWKNYKEMDLGEPHRLAIERYLMMENQKGY